MVRTYTAAVPPTPSHKPKKTLASPRRPPSRERENTPPPRRPSSVTRKSLQRQNSVHSLPSSSPSKNSTERSRSRGSLQMTPASDAGIFSTPAKSPSREAQTSATPVKTPTKERNSVSSRDISPISMTANPTQNDINSPPQVLLVAPKTPSKKRLERGNHVDNPESDTEEPLEKTTNPGVAIAVEEAIKNMFDQVTIQSDYFFIYFLCQIILCQFCVHVSNAYSRLTKPQWTHIITTKLSGRKRRRRRVGSLQIPHYRSLQPTPTKCPPQSPAS